MSDDTELSRSEQDIDFKKTVDLENENTVNSKILDNGDVNIIKSKRLDNDNIQLLSLNSSFEVEKENSAISEQSTNVIGSKNDVQAAVESQSFDRQTQSAKNMENVISKIGTNSLEETKVKTDSDREVLTFKDSLEIMSPEKVRCRQSRMSCNTDSREGKVDLRNSDSLPSQNVRSGDSNSKRHETQNAVMEDDISNDKMIRNDSLEFDPVISQDTGIGNDKEVTKDSKEHKEISYVNKTSDASAKRKDNSNYVDFECLSSIDEDVQNFGDKTSSVSNGKDIISEEIETDRKEMILDKMLPKTHSSHRVLKRQVCVNKKRDLENDIKVDYDIKVENDIEVNCEENQSTNSSESKPFIEGSHVAFEKEIENLQDNNDYTVLTREIMHESGGTMHSKKLKNIRRKIRSTCKFKDLDSVHETSYKQEQENIALAFMKHKHVDSSKSDCDIKVEGTEMDENGQETVNDIAVSQLPMSFEINIGTDTSIKCKNIVESLGSTSQDRSQPELVSESHGNIDTGVDIQNLMGTTEDICDQGSSNISTYLSLQESSNISQLQSVNELHSEGSLHVESTSYEKSTIDGTETTKIWLCVATSPERATSDSELNNVTMMLDSDTSGLIPVIDPDKIDADNSVELIDGKASLCPSRQMSTGFLVNQTSMERTQSIDSPVNNLCPVNNLPFVNTICDKEGVKSRKAASPLNRQTNVNSFETIDEESTVDEDNTLVDDKSDVILDIDDLLADKVDMKQKNKEQDASLSLFELTKHEHLIKEKRENDRSEADVLKNMIPDSHPPKYSDDTRDNEEEDTPYNWEEDTLDNGEEDTPDDGEEERNVCKSEPFAQNSSDNNNHITNSLIDQTNKLGCSYQYEKSTIRQGVSLDSDIVTVTSTTSLTTTSCRLSSSPDNLDSESLTVCQSVSRSTTPSVCSVDMASAPLSPMSISPFDFIIPISPLPPSPVRQVDRVSPLSPEQPAEILEKSSEVSETVVEDDIPNENEKNAGNIPRVVTPKKPILKKVMELSPLPDLISPIKTPKELGGKHKKKKKVKQKLASVSADVNTPVKFGSGVPTGVLTVKPKLESKTLITDFSTDDTKASKCESVTVVSNADTKLSVCKLEKFSSKDISLRKHVMSKKKIELVTHDESVFQRKHGREKQVSKDVKKELKTKTYSLAQSVTLCVQEDSSLMDQKVTHICDANRNKEEGVKKEKESVDATGDAKHEVSKTEVSTNELQMGKEGDVKDKQLNQPENKVQPDVLPAGYDPLMASKRKTRMAHQPRSHQHIVR